MISFSNQDPEVGQHVVYRKSWQSRAEQVKVFLTDSLLVAFNAYKETQLKIDRLNYEVEILKQKKTVSYYGWQDSEFEKELTAYVVKELGIKHPYYEKDNPGFQYEQEYFKARMIFRVDGYNFKFLKNLIHCKRLT